MHAARIRSAIARQQAAQLATRRLGGHINFAVRRRKAIRPVFEMMNHRFHTAAQLGARRRRKLAVRCNEGTGLEQAQSLPDDLDRFAKLAHAHAIARVNIAAGLQRHIKLKVFVAGIWHCAAHIKVHPRAAQRRARHAPRQRLIAIHNSNVNCARQINRILVQQALVVIQLFGKVVEERLDRFRKLGRHIAPHATRANIGRHHALSADQLKQVHDALAIAEAVDEDAAGIQVNRGGAQPNQMRGNALQLRAYYTQHLRALRHFNCAQLLNRQAIRQVVAHVVEVVHAVRHHQRL